MDVAAFTAQAERNWWITSEINREHEKGGGSEENRKKADNSISFHFIVLPLFRSISNVKAAYNFKHLRVSHLSSLISGSG